jgi:UDP-glucose 4-epimerase
MSKILITGNSGYIGSHLSQLLIKNTNLELHGLDKCQSKIELHSHFLQDISINSVWNIDEEYDCVIHLAAEVSVSTSVIDPTLYYLTNIFGTLNVLNKIKTKRLVIASTGAAEPMINPYGISKRAMEDIVIQHCRKSNTPFTIFRFYNVIGSDGINPSNPDGLFASLISAARSGKFTIFGNDYNTKDGTCVRDYTHVNEICNSVIKGVTHSTNQIENLGHGVGTTVKEIVELFKRVNNCNFDVVVGARRYGDIETSVLSNPSVFMEKLYDINQLLKVN